MERLANVSLFVRTILTFGMVLVVTIALGAFALVEISTVDRASTNLGKFAMPSLVQSSEMLNSLVNLRREEANRLLSVTTKDAEYREQLMEKYAGMTEMPAIDIVQTARKSGRRSRSLIVFGRIS